MRTTVALTCLLACVACNRPQAAKPPLTEADLVGAWNGHTTYTQKWIDETHARNPEGDYDLLVKSTMRREQQLRETIELREDGTLVRPPNLLGGPRYQSVTWSLSKDRTEILVAYVEADFRPSEERKSDKPPRTHTVRSYRIADDGQTLIALINDGYLPTDVQTTYHLDGSEANDRAFPDKKKQTEQWGCGPEAEPSDYFGTWTGHHTMSREHWEAIRGTNSLDDTNEAKREFEEDATLVLNRDMTFDFRMPWASSKGKWHMDASVAVLEHDDRNKPGYQSTRPSPTKMPVRLNLQADGTLVVELRKYGSTGPMIMTKT